ncbi:Transmembrane protein [Candidatus Terasakiella magnetica]|nr:Transmembrane protein [Candidatus Terasakiella magnetica]
MAEILNLIPSFRRIAMGAGLFLVLAAPSLREVLEQDMTRHMLIQLPFLVLAGWLLIPAAAASCRFVVIWDRFGIAGILTANLAAAYWMLPRSLDNAIALPVFEIAKFISLPLLVGVPLGCCWPRMPMLGKGFVMANVVSMLGIAGWLYLAAPVRVCVFYLSDQQEAVGRLLLCLAGAISLAVLFCAFVGFRPSAARTA